MDSYHYGEYEGNAPPKATKRGAYEAVIPVSNPPTDPSNPVTPKEPASWTMELATLSLSVLFFTAQVATLIWVMDKPYYEVWKVPLSLNAVIAILTTASKASQLHSVGEAIGQLKWIDFKASPRSLRQFELYDATSRGPQGAAEFVLKVRWGVATIGAFIIIFALAADPFTQQVIELTAQNVTTPDDTAVFIQYRDPGIQGAIMKGIYNIASPDEFQCGGACSWDGTYRSLGFSSICRDVKAVVEPTKACSKEGVVLYCNYTSPQGVFFSTESVNTDSATALVVAVNDTFFRGLFNETGRVSADFLQVAIFQSNSGEESNFNDPDIRAENITECTLSLALHEYSSVTANGSQLYFVDKTRRLEPGWHNVSTTSLNPHNITFNQSEIGPIDPPFFVNAYDWAGMVSFFESNAFKSHVIAGNAIEEKDTDRVGTGAAFLHIDPSIPFTALTEGMTDYLRSLSKGPNVEVVHGARVESVVFVRIRWQWLTLPLVQELAALVFVIWVIINNKRHSIPGWKSSALAILAHSVDHENSLVTNVQGPKDIKERAKNVDAQLR
ncbi:hypothetical protein NUW58_g957 [Xylaria curta]|uniref:Uncharacterized protein n=1 Tax=Xylaria curta TaxID=42375 RepID=A0ACC1PPB2_9PEZI|nr:hypothetical protein NUW58_g957 [Xylaria curta]